MGRIIIAPSLLAADMGNLERDIGLLEANRVQALHVDAMDGDFVPNIAFGPDQVKMLRPYTAVQMDVHMMISDPDRFVDAYVQAGADHVTVHAEACRHLHRSLQRIRDLGVTAGVALCPATSLETIRYVLDMADLVLVMTVNPGYGGQKNIASMKRKVRDLRRMREEGDHSFQIQVDGGIQQDNLTDYIEAGADNLVIGSAAFQKGKTDANLKKFNGMIMNVN
ncbi:MAG: ribulose-phosphate 3-epimerase [Peptococcaceae bacterium]|jgi:ribulose-phosphate 3-epimerase|nr:ribulose-phosphate 3-epimerase [Peptococcaceae bacterium]